MTRYFWLQAGGLKVGGTDTTVSWTAGGDAIELKIGSNSFGMSSQHAQELGEALIRLAAAATAELSQSNAE